MIDNLKIFRVYLCFFLFFFIFPQFSLCKQLFKISASKVEVLHASKVMVAQGNVFIKGKKFVIIADRVVYEMKTAYVHLFHFQIFDLETHTRVSGNNGTFDLRNKTFFGDRGIVFFKKRGIYLKYKDIKRNALNEYSGKKAVITTCKAGECFNCTAPWSVEEKNFIISPEGESSASSTAFKIKKLPVVYLPKVGYIPKVRLPISQPRKKGFLMPNFAQSTKLGFGIQLPYFYPVTDQLDFTIAPMYLTKRGLLWDLETALKLHEGMQSLFKFRYLHDSEDTTYAGEKEKKKKWWIVGKLDYIPSPNFDLHLDIDKVSEKTFLTEFDAGEGGFTKTRHLFLSRFGRDIEVQTQDYRSSHLWLNYFSKSFYFNWENKYINYIGDKDKEKIFQPVARFYTDLLPSKFFKNLLFSLKAGGGAYQREKGYTGYKIFDEVSLDFPFKFPITLPSLMHRITATYHQNFYSLERKDEFNNKSYHREYFQVDTYSTLLLKKNYDRFSHLFKPYFSYTFRSKPSSEKIPIFEEEDEQNKKINRIEYGIWNYFYTSSHPRLISLRAYQQYDFTYAHRSTTKTSPEERALSDLFWEFSIDASPRFFLRYDGSYNFYGLGLKKHSLNFTLRNCVIEFISLGYQEDRAWDTKQLNLSLGHHLVPSLYASFFLSRNLKKGENSSLRFALNYTKDCYSIGIGITRTPEEILYSFMIQLKGLGGYTKTF